MSVIQIQSLTRLEDMDKDNLLDVLTKIEDTLKKYWSDHEGFMSLQERILSLRMILEEIGEGVSTGDSPPIFISFAEIKK